MTVWIITATRTNRKKDETSELFVYDSEEKAREAMKGMFDAIAKKYPDDTDWDEVFPAVYTSNYIYEWMIKEYRVR